MMSTFLPKVLWIDDEYQKLSDQITLARSEGIMLVPFSNLQEGLAELERQCEAYEAVLLDAKFYEKADDVRGTEDTKYLFKARESINKLAYRKELEIFLLTGQYGDPEAIDGSIKKMFSKIYRKGHLDDEEQMYDDLRAAIEAQPTVQLRRKYASVLAACKLGYVGSRAGEIVMELLADLEADALTVKHLTEIRKVAELIMAALERDGNFPDDVQSLNRRSMYLSGERVRSEGKTSSRFLQVDKDSFPTEVGNLLRSLIGTTQSGSHPLYLDWLIRENRTDFWVKASLYQLLAVLEWYVVYHDSNMRASEYVR